LASAVQAVEIERVPMKKKNKRNKVTGAVQKDV
jgi:hypothetical protein